MSSVVAEAQDRLQVGATRSRRSDCEGKRFRKGRYSKEVS